MNRPINKLNDQVLSATGAIYWCLKPYWRGKKLEDQHFAYVLANLRKIELALKEINERIAGGKKI